MSSISVWLRRFFKLILYLVLGMLLLAFAWTAAQILSSIDKTAPYSSTTEARQEAYRATATALASEGSQLDLHANSAIVLLQEVSANTPPAVTSPVVPSTTETIAATPPPDNINLPTLLLPSDPAEGKSMAGTQVPTRVPEIRRDHTLINFMLLGSDEELTQDDFIRTDTMIVVSLNLETGTVSMLSLPRDLFVYIPHGSMGRLNTAFGIGELKNWKPDGGFGLLRQTIFYNFGINVHYYARVNFSGFESIIDRLGGVDIAVDCAYRDYYPVDNPNKAAGDSVTYRWRTLPVGYYRFSGFDALWYARIRKYTDDFDRGRRQQLLLRGIWRQLRSQGLLTTIPQVWGDVVEIVDTDIPFDLVLRLLPYLINLELSDMENFTFRKIYHTSKWTTPDGYEVLLPNPNTVAQLMQDFYTPPSSNQVTLAGRSIAVYNASGQENWDIVASERLRWDGYNAVALGPLENGQIYSSSVLVDNVASAKGSLVPGLIQALNMSEDQVHQEPKANRQYDYQVFIGPDYESCTFGVLPLDG